jgi:RecB family exonuclease
VEQDVEVQVGRARVRGQVDRLERDADGRLVVVDLKTGSSVAAKADLPRHAQLGVYQLVVAEGGFDEVVPGGESGGATLVYLGSPSKRHSIREQGPLADDEDPGWARELVTGVADGMAAATFTARTGSACRVCAARRACPAQLEGRQVGQ